jgi:excisionase family DNA binding protein
MNRQTHHQPPPSAEDRVLAHDASARLAHLVHEQRPLALHVRGSDAEQDQPIELPAAAVTLLAGILEAMAAGREVTIVPENAELSTAEAASLLNVSRPFLIKLLDEGAIPHRKVGTHRRIRMEDVMAYKERDDRAREAILDQLAREAQEQDMGYRRS